MKRFLFINLLLILASSLQAATIKGTLAARATVTLDKIHPFTKTKQQVATTQTDENGYFELDIQVTEQPEKFQLAAENTSFPFCVQYLYLF